MSDTTEATYCPECGDEFEMVSTTIWVNGKRVHVACHRRSVEAFLDTEIARLRVEIARLRDVLADLLIECELTAVKHPQQIATRARARAELERGA